MILSLLWSTFAVFVVVTAQNLTFSWPKHPQAYAEFPLTWDGGAPPYTVYVFMPDLTKYYYKYQGSDLSTTYNFPLTAGTEIVFQCHDSGQHAVTSPTITVISSLFLEYPHDLRSGVQTNILWGAGLSPYTVHVLSTDLTKYYWSCVGSSTSQEWTPDMPAGTQVRFQVIDANGVKVTSDVVTVHANRGLFKRALSGIKKLIKGILQGIFWVLLFSFLRHFRFTRTDTYYRASRASRSRSRL